MSLSLDGLISGLSAAGESTRLRLLGLCARGEWTVSELTQSLGSSQPIVSRHLKALCDSGLIDRRKEGSWVFYRLHRDGPAGALASHLIELLPRDEAVLRRDSERLAEIRRARAEQAATYFRANAERWDEIRRLHVDDAEVERRILDLLPTERISELLDIGTGSGRVLELFGEKGVRGVGIDLSREMLAVARANLAKAGVAQCHVEQADMYELPWAEPRFDAVTIHQVLHFADDPAAAIREAARVMREGGRMVIADFAPHNHDALRRDHEHRRLGFADGEIRDWIGAAGLVPGEPVRLPGRELTVCLWPAERPAPFRSPW